MCFFAVCGKSNNYYMTSFQCVQGGEGPDKKTPKRCGISQTCWQDFYSRIRVATSQCSGDWHDVGNAP